jgi:transcriptional regulator with XRE-family HTH domain
MYYTERIQWVRDCRSLTQTEVAKKLGIKQQQYARYEKGINIMPITYLPELCRILDVSADYLIGLTDEMRPLSEIVKSPSVTSADY